MSKFHNGPNGPGRCTAGSGEGARGCPFGGADAHYSSKAEAQVAFEEKLNKEYGVVPNSETKDKVNSKKKRAEKMTVKKEILSNLVEKGFAYKIPANDYILVHSSDVIGELHDWPYTEFNDNVEYSLDDGTTVTREYVEHINSILNDSTVGGSSHGLNYGISLKTEEDFDPKDLEFLRNRNFVIDHKIETDSVLVDVSKIDNKVINELEIPEESFYPIFDSENNQIDLNLLANE